MNTPSKESDSIQRVLIQTKDGVFTAYYSPRGLARLDFPDGGKPNSSVDHNQKPRPDLSAWREQTRSALERILEAKPPMSLPPLDLSAGTPFQQEVWLALRGIGLGKSMSYADVAREIGRPKAVRAVGQACGANPIPLLVPCHRVLASGGGLGGFSSGLPRKRRLLKLEGIGFAERVRRQSADVTRL